MIDRRQYGENPKFLNFTIISKLIKSNSFSIKKKVNRSNKSTVFSNNCSEQIMTLEIKRICQNINRNQVNQKNNYFCQFLLDYILNKLRHHRNRRASIYTLLSLMSSYSAHYLYPNSCHWKTATR